MTAFTTVAPEINRDHWGRPLVVPPDGGKPVPYLRATTLAGTLDDLYGLMSWKQRQTALGLADRPDLRLAVTAHRDDKRRLDAICEEAMQAAASTAAATTGTAIHALTELVDRGQDLPALEPAAAADLDAYRRATAELEVVAIEQFCVLDDLKVAGTPDRIVRWRGEHFIADIKTSQDLTYGAQKIAIQLALYAHAQAYDAATGQRTPLPQVNQRGAIIIHVPAGSGTAQLLWSNIARGWEAVDLALNVRAWRREVDLIAPFN